MIYPIKSCRGVELLSAKLTKTGLQHDREYMLATANPEPGTGMHSNMVTSRDYAAIALLQPGLPDKNGITIRVQNLNRLGSSKNCGSYCEPFFVPLVTCENTHKVLGAKEMKARVCAQDVVEGVDQGDAVARWITEYLRLVKTADGGDGSTIPEVRLLRFEKRYVPEGHTRGDRWRFPMCADGVPFLVVSEQTIEKLNTYHDEPPEVTLNRYQKYS